MRTIAELNYEVTTLRNQISAATSKLDVAQRELTEVQKQLEDRVKRWRLQCSDALICINKDNYAHRLLKTIRFVGTVNNCSAWQCVVGSYLVMDDISDCKYSVDRTTFTNTELASLIDEYDIFVVSEEQLNSKNVRLCELDLTWSNAEMYREALKRSCYQILD